MRAFVGKKAGSDPAPAPHSFGSHFLEEVQALPVLGVTAHDGAHLRSVQRTPILASSGDPYEREAEKVADEVTRVADPGSARAHSSTYRGLGTSRDGHGAGGRGAPLPDDVRSYFEPRFRFDFSKVRVHSDGESAERAHALRARAYTVGRDIVFGAGEYSPATREGRRLLAHELVHVVQQAGGTAAAHGAPAAQPTAARGAANVGRISSLQRPAAIQRFGWKDVVNIYEWTNPLTFSSKLLQHFTGAELNTWFLLEQSVRASATRISLPAGHIAALRRYAAAVPSDGKILDDALSMSPGYYQGGWLLDAVGDASAITFGDSIFFRNAPPAVHTFIHEMVHIHQWHLLGRTAFVLSYFGASAAEIAWRRLHHQRIHRMRSNPHEEEAYRLEARFMTWHATHH